MADEANPVVATPAAEAAPAAPVADVPDAVREVNDMWEKFSADDRLAVIELARAEAARRAAPPPEPEPKKPAATATPNLTPAAAVSDTDRMVREMYQERQAEKAAREAEARRKAWESDVNREIDSLDWAKDDADLRELLFEATAGKAVLRGQTPREAVKAAAGKFKARLEREQESAKQNSRRGYVDSKMQARAALGESGGGRVSGGEPAKVTANDLDSGAVAQRVREALGI